MILWNNVTHSLTKYEKKKDMHNLLSWKLKIKNPPTMVDGTSRKFAKVSLPLKNVCALTGRYTSWKHRKIKCCTGYKKRPVAWNELETLEMILQMGKLTPILSKRKINAWPNRKVKRSIDSLWETSSNLVMKQLYEGDLCKKCF